MTRRSSSDETLYCEHCGISFLWTGEEQRVDSRDAEAEIRPLRCPGCRHLLPSEEHERGLVKWYSGRKRYGFIVRPGQPDLFVHRSALMGGKRLHSGDLVEYRVTEADDKLSACDVRTLVLGEE